MMKTPIPRSAQSAYDPQALAFATPRIMMGPSGLHSRHVSGEGAGLSQAVMSINSRPTWAKNRLSAPPFLQSHRYTPSESTCVFRLELQPVAQVAICDCQLCMAAESPFSTTCAESHAELQSIESTVDDISGPIALFFCIHSHRGAIRRNAHRKTSRWAIFKPYPNHP